MPKTELKIGGEYLVPVVVTEVKKAYIRCELAGSKGAMPFLFPHDVTAGFLPASEAKQNKKCRKSTEASKKREARVGHIVVVEEDDESVHVVTTGSPKRIIRSYGKNLGTNVAQVLALAAAVSINKLWTD
jgi:hypothetical protein